MEIWWGGGHPNHHEHLQLPNTPLAKVTVTSNQNELAKAGAEGGGGEQQQQQQQQSCRAAGGRGGEQGGGGARREPNKRANILSTSDAGIGTKRLHARGSSCARVPASCSSKKVLLSNINEGDRCASLYIYMYIYFFFLLLLTTIIKMTKKNFC